MDKSKNMKTKEAAKLMGKSEMFIRIGLRRGILPFGHAIQTKDERWSYHISRKQFEEYMGE